MLPQPDEPDGLALMARNRRTSNGNLYRKNRAWLRSQGLPCALCGKPIDYALPGGDPWSFEVDHVTPCAKGGALFDRANLQPAHRICNELKSDKTGPRKEGKAKAGQRPTICETSRDW